MSNRRVDTELHVDVKRILSNRFSFLMNESRLTVQRGYNTTRTGWRETGNVVVEVRNSHEPFDIDKTDKKSLLVVLLKESNAASFDDFDSVFTIPTTTIRRKYTEFPMHKGGDHNTRRYILVPMQILIDWSDKIHYSIASSETPWK